MTTTPSLASQDVPEIHEAIELLLSPIMGISDIADRNRARRDTYAAIDAYATQRERAALEKAAEVAKQLYARGSAHTYASENAEHYRTQEETCEEVAAAIQALLSLSKEG